MFDKTEAKKEERIIKNMKDQSKISKVFNSKPLYKEIEERYHYSIEMPE